MFIPINERQFEFWKMRRGGMANVEIAKKFNISRQAVSKALQGIDSKISKVLMGMARANHIEIKKVNFERGILFGHLPQLETDVIIFVSSKQGVQTWYRHQGDCDSCSRYKDCIELLWDYAEEVGVKLSGSDNPTGMADELFKKLEELI